MDIPESEKTKLLHRLMVSARKIGLVTHFNPDGDAVGSTLALRHYLSETCGKDVRVFFPTPVPFTLSFLMENADFLCHADDSDKSGIEMGECDLIICLDISKFSRTGEMEGQLAASKAAKVLIDHHPHPDTEPFSLVFSDTEVSSTCELLYRILLSMPEIMGNASRLPLKTAEDLMTGMTTDTNNFENSVFPGTLAMASELLSVGVDRDRIVSELYNRYSFNRIKLFSAMLGQHLHVTGQSAAYMIITKEIWEEFGCGEGETDRLVNIPLTADKIRLSILLREDEGFFRVSIRSKKGTSAARLASEMFHGGGHECASGGRLFFPEDIPTRDLAGEYIEKVTARFLQERDDA